MFLLNISCILSASWTIAWSVECPFWKPNYLLQSKVISVKYKCCLLFIIIINIGKWSDISVMMIPILICLFKKALVSIRSIAVAFVLLTVVGLLIGGIRLFWSAKLTIFYLLYFLSKFLFLFGKIFSQIYSIRMHL